MPASLSSFLSLRQRLVLVIAIAVAVPVTLMIVATAVGVSNSETEITRIVAQPGGAGIGEAATRHFADAGRRMMWNYLIAGLAGIVAVALSAGIIAHALLRPIDRLAECVDLDGRAGASSESREPMALASSAVDRLKQMRAVSKSVTKLQRRLSSVANRLEGLRSTLATGAEATAGYSEHATRSAEGVNYGVQVIAEAVEQFKESIREIANSATRAASISSGVSDTSAATQDAVKRLWEGTKVIGGVATDISDIAEQTDILALNATIEAARAGDAGRGFSVVANQVKELANQAAQSAAGIGAKVGSLHDDVSNATDGMARIQETVEEVKFLQETIAAAVAEQSTVAANVSENAVSLVENASEVAADVEKLAACKEYAASGARGTEEIAREIAAISDEMASIAKDVTN